MTNSRSAHPTVYFASLFSVFVLGCSADTGHQGAIRGHVTLDGQPVEQGSILFMPIDGTSGVVVGGEIRNGQYSLTAAKGPAIGRNRVEIRVAQKTGKMIPKGLGGTGKMVEEQVEGVAPEYNVESKLVFEVKPGDNTADYEVASK